MKLFLRLSLFSLLFASTAIASEIPETVHEKAKEIRRSFWQSGYEEVSSSVEKMSIDALKHYTKSEENRHYEEPLTSDEISNLFRCYHREECDLYHIVLSSEYMGGYGVASYFVHFYPTTEKLFVLSHTTYSE